METRGNLDVGKAQGLERPAEP
ncbi:hypothetical protein J007_01481 [Cryptococcus neoformans]|nr:hypothetical protein J007_01481 [Cryptococcus neoformans var. grubii]OXC63299.1 hypothetical protein C358_01485 [Cryptococcus neoformans var. grubii MW-RSA852]